MPLRHKFSNLSLAGSFAGKFKRGESSTNAPNDTKLEFGPEDPYGDPYGESSLPPSETSAFGNPSFVGKPHLELPLSDPSLNTPHAILFYAVNKFPLRRCLAYRKISGYENEVLRSRNGMQVRDGLLINDGVVEKETVLVGEWEYLTYQQVGRNVLALAAALGGFVKGGKMHMFAKNSANWFMLSHAASLCEITIATVYTKIGPSTFTETLTQCESTAIFIDTDLFPVLLASLVVCPYVTTIIYSPASVAERDIENANLQIETFRNVLNPEIVFISFDELLQLGECRLPKDSDAYVKSFCNRPQKCDTKATLWSVMYPLADPKEMTKGVRITNGNVVAGIAGIHHVLKSSVQKGDTYLSYLPLCFMLEYTLVNAFLLFGLTIGFGTKTISYLLPPPYSNLHESCRGDIESFAPSILFGIPPWWDDIHSYVLDLVKEHPSEWQDSFWKQVARKAGQLVYPGGVLGAAGAAITDRASCIKSMREMFFGTRVRWIGVSCAMEATEKKEFLGTVMSSSGKMVEGYSFMEMSTVVTFTPLNRYEASTLGSPLPSLEMKLISVNPRYLTTTNPPRGEIYIRGPSVPHLGYFRCPEETIAAFREGGWVSTGNIGEWDNKKSCLRVVDRVKPLSERFMGEYVPVEILETKYAECDMVIECCLFYSARKTQPIAVVAVCEKPLRRYINKQLPLQAPGMFIDEILLSLPIRKLFVRELNIHGRRQGLVDFELLGGVILVNKPLPKLPRPQAAANTGQSRSGWFEMTDMDNTVILKEELDRTAVRALYACEIEHEFL